MLELVREEYECGDVYHGEVRDVGSSKVKDGRGRYEFANGSLYDGEWRNGTMHGKGMFFESQTGDRFEGTWAFGRRVCGVYRYANGDLYLGAFDAVRGTMKHGRSMVVDDMVLFETEYLDDNLIRKVPFDTSLRDARVNSALSPRRVDPAGMSGEEEEDAREAPSQDRDVHRRPHKTTSAVAAAAAGGGSRSGRGSSFGQQRRSSGDRQDSVSPTDSSIDERRARVEAAKLILKSSRMEAEEKRKKSKVRSFGSAQRGDMDRFESLPPADTKEAFRFHYR